MAKRRRNRRPADTDPCPCGSGAAFAACCGPIVAGAAPATTAEALMRSRYTAYTLADQAHLRRSWHPETCPAEVTVDRSVTWRGLEILGTESGRALDATGVVAFAAHYDAGSGPAVMRERSRFARVDGAWVYVDGDPLV